MHLGNLARFAGIGELRVVKAKEGEREERTDSQKRMTCNNWAAAAAKLLDGARRLEPTGKQSSRGNGPWAAPLEAVLERYSTR